MKGHIPDPRRIEVVDEAVAGILRQKTPGERIEMVSACARMVRLAIGGYFRTQHPDWTEEQVAAAVARRIAGGAD